MKQVFERAGMPLHEIFQRLLPEDGAECAVIHVDFHVVDLAAEGLDIVVPAGHGISFLIKNVMVL